MKIIKTAQLLDDWLEGQPEDRTITIGALRKKIDEFHDMEMRNAAEFWESVNNAYERMTPEENEAYLRETDTWMNAPTGHIKGGN